MGPIYSPSEIDSGSIPLGILKLKVILYSYLGPFSKNSAQPKTRQKGETFSMMHVVSHRICLECIVYIQEKCLLMPLFFLPLKKTYFWTQSVQPIRAQSIQLSKIAKKLNIDLCHFYFFPIERKHCSY